MPETALSDIAPFLFERTPDLSNLRQLELVLQAKRIPYRITSDEEGIHVWIPLVWVETAKEELKGFLEEKSIVIPEPPELGEHQGVQPLWAVMVVLIGIHVLVHLPIGTFFMRLGAAKNGEILTGAWWQTITALTLHADAQHLFGNLLFGGVMLYWLTRMVGNGMGIFMVVLSGAIGNGINALVQPLGHTSLGASTGVFGALGVLMGLRMQVHNENRMRGLGIPLLIGMVMLGLFGAGPDPRTDVGAHLFGFLTGMPVGFIWWTLWQKSSHTIWRKNAFWGFFAFSLVLFCWTWAWFFYG